VKKILALTPLILLFVLIIPSRVFAEVLFEEHFDNGNASNWTPVLNGSYWVVDNQKGYGGIINGGGVLTDTVANVDITTPNYTIEYDFLPVQGADKNFDFHWQNNSPLEEVHFAGNDVNFKDETTQYVLSNNVSHKIKIDIQGKKFQFYVDGNKVFDAEDPQYIFSGHEQIGLRMSAGSVFPTEVWFDNVKVTTEGDDTLGVPLIKQTDPLWANNIYDTAFAWTPGSKNIGTWGCALTSAVMVFRYNGITKTPTGEDLNPGTVNSWLLGSVDGYVRNGLLNWLALTRLSRLATLTNVLPFDALEYKRINHKDDVILADSLGKKIPPILEEPGHFVVANGTDSANSTFFINDPGYTRTTLNDSYNKNYLTMGTYTPVNSDLSYIMLVVDPNINLSVTDPNGAPIGEVFIQSAISDPLGLTINTKGPLKIYYYPKPTSGKYSVILSTSGSSPYQLDEYLYDINGNVFKKTENGNLNGTKDTFIINFDKTNFTNSKTEKITFEYLKKEIVYAYNQKKIKNVGIYTALLGQLEIARISRNKSFKKTALDSMILVISKDKKNIEPALAAILISDIQSLKNSL